MVATLSLLMSHAHDKMNILNLDSFFEHVLLYYLYLLLSTKESVFFFILLLIFNIVICFITSETCHCFPAGRTSTWCYL